MQYIAKIAHGCSLGTGWGLGFAIRTNPDFSLIPGSVRSFNWQGSWGTFFSVEPEQKLILVMMMQRAQSSLRTDVSESVDQL